MIELAKRLDPVKFSRERNADGEFAPDVPAGPDPASMAKAYGAPAARRAKLGVGRAVLAGAGALASAALLTRRLKRNVVSPAE
jgi:hypothetical protein